jgi:subtilisin family serine protease
MRLVNRNVFAVGLLLVGLLLSPAAPSLPGAAATGVSKVSQGVLADTVNGKQASFLILMAEQADLSAATTMQDQNARGRWVAERLRETASRNQGPLKALLTKMGVAHRSYWSANMIAAEGRRDLIQMLAARGDVKAIESNRPIPGPRVVEPTPQSDKTAPNAPQGIEWGTATVKAPELWNLGFTGQDIVVATNDTGVYWEHPALKGHYRGWNGTMADHNYNWHDSIHGPAAPDSPPNPCGYSVRIPCDDGTHGTHVTGTMVGDEGMNHIGVAPGAKWIGCRNMDDGDGRPEFYAECFQFFIEPTDLDGLNPRSDLRPHVVNNSWGCPPEEFCAPNTLKQIVEDTEAAGIMVVASAGNHGRAGCSTVDDPPAIYEASFSVAALDDVDNKIRTAEFSSLGPVLVDGSGRMKPNVGAPGVDVRSSVTPRTSLAGYANFQGTSMASPHVAGVVALLWSAIPDFKANRDIPATKRLLTDTANRDVWIHPNQPQTCGGKTRTDIPNNHFGYGMVDALAAYLARP